MADTLTATNPVLRTRQGQGMGTVKKLMLSGQSWKAGQFLYDGAEGQIKTCASSADSGTGGIQYYALADQTDPANNTTYVTVGVIEPDHEFEMNENSTTLGDSLVGKKVNIVVASNVVTVDKATTSDPAVKIVALGSTYNPAEYDTTDNQAKCRVRVLRECLDADNA